MTFDPRESLRAIGLPAQDGHDLPPSTARFPDGASYRFEIPSVEGPRCFDAVLAEADRLGVPVTRVSQGSGVGLLTNAELRRMAEIGAGAGVEVSLFARPSAGWGPSASSRAQAGAAYASAARGQDELRAVVDQIRRAADHGIRSVLISDIGVLSAFGKLRARGALPADMQAKISVMLPVTNPATAQVLVELGANTLNLAPDLSMAQVAAIRGVTEAPIDFYIESPDDIGGFVRYHELSDLVSVAAPVYVKLGLRNSPNIYPSGGHLDATAVALCVERVRRALIAKEALEASASPPVCSKPGASGLALPVV